ncbi:MAG: bifunctional DNA-formamidopyrimidine glycosylase/DNA-(apurinic or apyrimidinic site) lyase [Desulfonatronovibrio sp.]
MPELPEVETIARGLEPMLVDRTVSRARIYYPGIILGDADSFANRAVGKKIKRVWRRAKLLIFDLSDSLHLAFHLKMTGKVWIPPKGSFPDKHTHLVLDMDDNTLLFFQDQRKFGYCALFSSNELYSWRFFSTLGPEPLDLSPEAFFDIVNPRKARIKSLLLDQKVVAGIGNIYADESLFMSGIHPEAQGNELSFEETTGLLRNLRLVLLRAIEAGGSSFRDYRNALGYSGTFQEEFLIYGKKGQCCPRCKTIIQTCKVAGRTSSVCPACQKA